MKILLWGRKEKSTNEKSTKEGRVLSLGPAVMIWLCACLSGCSLGPNSKALEERKAIIDDYKEIVLAKDRDSARFDQALEILGTYVETPTSEKKEETATAFWEIVEEMEADSAGFVSYEASEELEKLLGNQGISVAEYEAGANFRYTELEDYIQNLSYLGAYLEISDMAQMAMDDLEAAVRRYHEYQKVQRAYCYTEINYWFAPWGKEAEEYIKEQVMDQLTSFEADGARWEYDQDVVDEKMNGYLDEMEVLINDMAEFLGESTQRLYDMMEMEE